MREKNNYNGLSGLKILITGATDGLGFEISIALAEAGADVIAVGRDKKKLEDLSDNADQTKGTVTLVCIDLAKQGTIEDLSRKISEKFGTLEIIIHCAMSSLQMMPINQVSLKEIETNLLSPITICFRLITCFHGILTRSPKGLFVYISDNRTKKFNGPYNSVKKACEQLFFAYHEENKRLGVNVLIQYPKPMRTKLRKKAFPGENAIGSDAVKKETTKIIDQILKFSESERIIS